MTSDAKREATRRRVARLREREAARRVARAEAAARRLEEVARAAEEVVPLAQRSVVADASGTVLRGARLVVSRGRAVRTLPTHKLSRPQIIAVMQLRSDWEEVGAGLGIGTVDFNRATGHRTAWSAPPGQDAMLRQLRTRERLECAIAVLGAFLGIVRRVILDGIPVSAWAAESGESVDDAFAQLHAALNRLVAFYDVQPRGARHAPRAEIRTVAPPREEYEV